MRSWLVLVNGVAVVKRRSETNVNTAIIAAASIEEGGVEVAVVVGRGTAVATVSVGCGVALARITMLTGGGVERARRARATLSA